MRNDQVTLSKTFNLRQWASLVVQLVKNLPVMQETRGQYWGRKIPWRRKWQPTPVLLPGKFHGQRSLVGYSPWHHKESDMTEGLHFYFQLIFSIAQRQDLPCQSP